MSLKIVKITGQNNETVWRENIGRVILTRKELVSTGFIAHSFDLIMSEV